MNAVPEGRGFFRRLLAILLQRCPRCFRGRVFKRLIEMNDPCPVCGQLFQREEGYFLGAMYVSYALGCALVSVGYFGAIWMWPDVPVATLCLVLAALYVPLMPLVFRYSRVIFLHLDYLDSWGDSSASAYAKLRERQLSASAATSPRTPDGRTPPG
jgi:uncharacterized protein (DUF983 family)